MTDDAERLQERLETATGERISALEAVASAAREAHEGRVEQIDGETRATPERNRERTAEVERDSGKAAPDERGPERPVRERSVELELEL